MNTKTVGELIALLSQFPADLPVVGCGESWQSFAGSATIKRFVPVRSSYHDYEEADDPHHGYMPAGPAFDAVYLS